MSTDGEYLMFGIKGNGAAPAGFVRHVSDELSPDSVLGRIRLAVSVRRERRALRGLDDAALKDIGLSRFDVERESTRGLFDFPSQNPNDRRYRV